jgi:hypothetical protein
MFNLFKGDHLWEKRQGKTNKGVKSIRNWDTENYVDFIQE